VRRPAPDVFRDHRSNQEPLPAAEEITGAEDDRAHAAVAGLGMRCSISTRMPPLRVWAASACSVEHRRHAAAVVPHAARTTAGSRRWFGRRDRRIGKRQRVLLPFGDDRIECVEHTSQPCAAATASSRVTASMA